MISTLCSHIYAHEMYGPYALTMLLYNLAGKKLDNVIPVFKAAAVVTALPGSDPNADPPVCRNNQDPIPMPSRIGSQSTRPPGASIDMLRCRI